MGDEILIINAGFVGTNCALNASEYGTKVYLVDYTTSIGGIMAMTDTNFTQTATSYIMAPKPTKWIAILTIQTSGSLENRRKIRLEPRSKNLVY